MPLLAETFDAPRDPLAAVLDAFPAGVAVLRAAEDAGDLRIAHSNPAFRGFAAEPSFFVEGCALDDLWPDEDGLRLRSLVERAALGERPPPERIVARPDGAPRSFLANAAPVAACGDVLLVLWDTTELDRTRAGAERARERAELLASMAGELSARADLVAVLRTALERGTAISRADDGALFLLEPDGRHLRPLEWWSRDRTDALLDLDRLPHSRAALSILHPVLVTRPECAQDESAWFDRLGIWAVVAAPLLVGGAPLGFLYLSYRRVEDVPSEEDVELTGAIASQCALAITRAQLHEENRAQVAAAESARVRAEIAEAVTRRIAQRLALMQELTSALSSAHDRAEVIRATLERAVAAMGARSGSVSLQEGDALVLHGAIGVSADVAERWSRLPLAARSPGADAFGAGLPVLAESRAEIAARWPDLVGLADDAGEEAWAALPLAAGGEPFGVLVLSFAAPRRFDLEERAFMVSLAEKSAQALERARLFEAERALRAEAERIGRLQEQLLAVVGHDLRTPLSAITMGTGVLFRRGGLDERQAQTLTRMAASAERMVGIIRDLLDFSRARQGSGIPIARAPVDLRAVASRAILELQAAHPHRAIAFLSRGDVSLAGDESRLLQVVSNLAGNAVQHAPEDARIEVEVEGDASGVRLAVRNGGPPIAPEVLPIVFEPFKGGGARSGESGSVGLGLFIVREIVRAHGGEVEVRSVGGEGTTFTVRLPRS